MIKTAIIGYGYMGEIRHRVANEHPDLTVTLICETDPAKAKKVFGVPVVHDAREVIESDAELVFVCTPNNLIPEITVECLKRGKHVFAEKPPGRCLQDIVDMRVQEEKSKECKLMFGFNHRYHPGVMRAKNYIKSGDFGRVLWLRGIYGKSGGKDFAQSWRNQKNISGGGILLDQGIHMLDLFNYYCGNFEDVKSFMSNDHWKFPVEDNAFVLLRNKDRQFATLHSSATLWKHRFQIDIGLENGYMTVEGLLSKSGSYGRETLKVARKLFEDEADAVGNPAEEITYFDRDLSWEMEANKMVDAIKNNKPITESSSMDAYRVMEIIDKAYKDDNWQVDFD